MVITLDDCPQPVPGVVGRMIESAVPTQTEAVLVLPEKGQVKVLNEVGARIWKLVDSKNSVRQIAENICREYQVEQNQAEADTMIFISDLIDRGIVTFIKK